MDVRGTPKVNSDRHMILVVDDSEMNCLILKEILTGEFDIIEAHDGIEALEQLHKNAEKLSLVLLDIVMPRMDGFEVLAAMNKHRWIERLPVIMISGETDSSYVRRAYELGAADYISRPFDEIIILRRMENVISLYDRQKKLAALAVDQIYEREKSSRLMINVLSNVMEQRNGESGRHVVRISQITEILAKSLLQCADRYPMTHKDISILSAAATIHDIGKIVVPEEILNKPGKLTPEEFEIMKEHSALGAQMLANIPFCQDEPLVKRGYEICRWHHERWDGRGYPDGLKGDAIPISAQIVSLADVYDALTSERIYKKAVSHAEAIRMIASGECGCFNPLLLESLLSIQDRLEAELSAAAMEKQDEREIAKAVEDALLQYDLLPKSDSTLQMLEYERTKLQFYNSISEDIQFEYIFSPDMLVLSEEDAAQLGMSAITVDPLQSEKFQTVIAREDRAALIQRIHQATQEEPVLEIECKLKLDGQELWHRIICRTLWDEAGRCTGVIGKAIDIHRDRIEIQHIRAMIHRDALTGLLNWPIAQAQIRKKLEARPNDAFAMVFLDLNDFRSANKVHGHAFGDRMLKHVAQQLVKFMPEDAVISRIGGDEFVIFLPCREDADGLAQSVSRTVEGAGGDFSVSASMGIALRLSGGTEDCSTLLRHAEQALYIGKRSRPNYRVYRDVIRAPVSVLSPIESEIRLPENAADETKQGERNK